MYGTLRTVLFIYSSKVCDIILGFALGSVEGRVAIQYVNAANPKVNTNCVSLYKKQLLWIRIEANGDPDPAFYLNADPDPGSQTNR
jgi:hypothetical protein